MATGVAAANGFQPMFPKTPAVFARVERPAVHGFTWLADQFTWPLYNPAAFCKPCNAAFGFNAGDCVAPGLNGAAPDCTPDKDENCASGVWPAMAFPRFARLC